MTDISGFLYYLAQSHEHTVIRGVIELLRRHNIELLRTILSSEVNVLPLNTNTFNLIKDYENSLQLYIYRSYMYRISIPKRPFRHPISSIDEFDATIAARETVKYGSTILIRRFSTIRNYIQYINLYLDKPRYTHFIPSVIDGTYEELVPSDINANGTLLSVRMFESFQLMNYNNVPLLCLFLRWSVNLTTEERNSLELRPGELMDCIRNSIRCIKRISQRYPINRDMVDVIIKDLITLLENTKLLSEIRKQVSELTYTQLTELYNFVGELNTTELVIRSKYYYELVDLLF